jgi:HD-GYP domain-containing protein (c-di-GMP phosphodiesterase class II)
MSAVTPAGLGPVHRSRLGLEFAISGHREVDKMIEHHAAIARTMGEHLQLAPSVLDALGAAYERWDGRGWPGALEGEAVPLASRVAQVAEYVEVANRLGGAAAVRDLAHERRGRQFDPHRCDVLDAEADVILSGLDEIGTWDAVIAAEPTLAVMLWGEPLDEALLALANFIDIKSPYFLGHSRAVADLSAEAARRLDMSESDRRALYRTSLVHDWGRLGISNAIWDKKGTLGAGEWERVRLLPHITDRMLRQSESLAPLAAIAVQHRERLDGSGYPAGLSGSGISRSARILAAADAYQAMREPRPHRGALGADAAASELRAEVRAGRRRCRRCGARRGRPSHPAASRGPGRPHATRGRGPDPRRARSLEQGDRRPARHLSQDGRKPRRAHLREDRRLSNRAAASLFAMRHGLLPEEGFPGHQAAS